MPVDEGALTTTITRLQALTEYLSTKQAEASQHLDRLVQLAKIPDEKGRLQLPIDSGTGGTMSASRRDAIYDSCYADAAALLAEFDSPAPNDPPGSG